MRSLCGIVVVVAVGCQAPGPAIPTYPVRSSAVQQVQHIEPAPATMGLDALLSLAHANNPDVVAAVARVGEARGRMIQAGLYPNPTVGYSGNQINDGPGTAGMQGGFASQEFVTAGKLALARDAARHGVTAADWAAASKWYDTATKVKAAYYEYATALAVLRETERMAELFAGALTRVEALAAGGKVETYDVTRLRLEHVQAANRVGAARQRVTAATRLLAVAVGVETLPCPVTLSELPDLAPVPEFAAAVALAGQSSFVLAPAAEVAQVRTEVRQAEVKPIPNVTVMTMVGHDNTTSEPTVSVQVGLPLPLWDRNQGNIAAAKSRLHATTAGVEQARLRAIERLTAAYQRYDNARRLLELSRTKILPDATAALEQIDRVYTVKPERFFDTLDARRVLAQARIDYVQTIGDLWAAVAEIEAITQQR